MSNPFPLCVHGMNHIVFDHTARVQRIWARMAGRKPWAWAKLPGLHHDTCLLWCRTRPFCDEPDVDCDHPQIYYVYPEGYFELNPTRASWLTSERRPESRRP